MRKIIFLNQETGPLLIDIINVFSNNGYNVILYTGEVITTYSTLHKGVKVRRLTRYNKSNNFYRICTWSIFFLQSMFYLFCDLKKNTKIYFSSNPPFIHFLGILFNNKIYIHIYDVYPNALLALPYVNQRSFIYKSFSYVNKLIFNKAISIIAPSIGMGDMLNEYVDKNKIKVVSWWADTDFIVPIKKEKNKFISQNNLENKFIVMYSGNFGLTHNIEKVLDAALLLKNYNNIVFVIIGNGPKKKLIDSFQEKNRLNNLLILPFQSIEMLPHSLTSSDISIVLDSFSFNNDLSTASIPSKMFYLMSAGSVIYAEADEKSELNRLIKMYNLGLCDSSKETNNLIKFIKFCVNNKHNVIKFKNNSRNASFNFTKNNAEIIYNKININ